MLELIFVKTLWLLLGGAILGLLFFLSLPAIFMGMFVVTASKQLFLKLVPEISSFGWRPAVAYLAGKKKVNKANKSQKKVKEE